MRFWLVLGLIVSISPFAHAKDSADSTQIYYVYDVVAACRACDQPPAEFHDIFGDPNYAPKPKHLTKSLQDSWPDSPLMSHIVQSIHDGGGKVSFLAAQYQMVVTASAAQQAALAATFKDIRREQLKSVSIETWGYRVDAKALAAVDPATRTLLSNQAGNPWPSMLNSVQESRLEQTLAGKEAFWEPGRGMKLFLNQFATVFMGTGISYISDFTSGHDHGHMTFAPVSVFVNCGLAASMRATANADGSIIALDFRGQTSDVFAIDEKPWPQSPPGQHLMIEVPKVETHAIDRMLLIPLGQTALLWMGTGGRNEDVFLLVRPSRPT
jgi:hypothetical protein